MRSRLSLLALTILAFMLPFEAETTWFKAGPIAFTNVEAWLGFVLLLAFGRWLQQRRPGLPIPQSWAVLGVLFVGGLILSSLLAPELRSNALKATFRTISGLLLLLAVPQLVQSPRDMRWVAAGVVGGGFIASLIGLAESASGAAFGWLTLFRQIPTMAGPFIRLTGPFDYANQAAMFIEASLPLLLAFTWSAYQSRRYVLTGGLVIAFLIYVEASILTYSRSSFTTILLVNLLMAAFLWLGPSRPQKRLTYLWLGAGGIVMLLVLSNTLLSAAFRLRFNSESDIGWYQAHIEVPAEFRITADETLPLSVTVTNQGSLTWRPTGPTPVVLAARWVQPATKLEWAQQSKWSLRQEVRPGESISLVIPVKAPKQEGEYEVIWDMVQENIVWFGQKSGIVSNSQVTVLENPRASEGSAAREMPLVKGTEYVPPIPGRLTLWTVAWRQFRRYPVLGIGLDNFRLTYGRELGYSNWNESVHTNSWYWETLVSLGLVGTLPFFAWLLLLLIDMGRRLRHSTVTLWQMAIAAGLLAYLIHGLLDYFLLFNATALLFWLLVGLWISQNQIVGSHYDDPDRV